MKDWSSRLAACRPYTTSCSELMEGERRSFTGETLAGEAQGRTEQGRKEQGREVARAA